MILLLICAEQNNTPVITQFIQQKASGSPDVACICCLTPYCGAVVARRPPLSIDIFCPHGAQQQTAAATVDQWDGQTDGCSNKPCFVYFAGNVIKWRSRMIILFIFL